MQSSLHHTLRERSGEMNPHPRFVGCARRESVLGFLSEVSETQQGCEREKQAPALSANRGLTRVTSLQVKKIQD